MSEIMDLVVIEKKNAMAVFTNNDQLDPLIEAIEKEARSLVPDVTTKKGRDAIASMAHKVARSKTYIDNAGKDLVAEQCRMVGLAAGCPWAFENPVSVFSSIFGSADYTFHPYQFTGLCADDNYTKQTCLWTGNGFKAPAENMHPMVEAAIDAVKLACGRMMPKKKAIEAISGTSFAGLVTDWYPDNRIHECPPSDERANIRSATPLGFARAVFLSNAPHLNKKREAA